MVQIPEVKRIVCGEVEIHWLSRATPVTEASLGAWLLPEERTRAEGMRAAARRQEYLRARYLVRLLSDHRGPLPHGASGEPSWPPGLVGSITHKDGFVGVALAQAGAVRSLGIDAENCERLHAGLEPKILGAEESALLDRLGEQASGWSRNALLTVAFSFKESLFKCHFPFGQTMFYFHDALIESLDLVRGVVAARLLVTTSPWTPEGTRVQGAFVRLWDEGRDFVLSSVIQRP